MSTIKFIIIYLIIYLFIYYLFINFIQCQKTYRSNIITHQYRTPI